MAIIDSQYPEPPFKVLFFIMDKIDQRTIAVEEERENDYLGLSYKETRVGWDSSSISIGKSLVALPEYELTKDTNEAMMFAKLSQ